jgi:solute carrier family 25 (mitochondrial uncoupling protein), member 27
MAVHFAAAMIAGVVCATASAPVDTIKSRYMNQRFSEGRGQIYSSAYDCFRQTVNQEGFMALFKGWVLVVHLGPAVGSVGTAYYHHFLDAGTT